MRGEYRFKAEAEFFYKELPPRARRILPLPVRAVPFLGTTSACAENTSFPTAWPPQPRNYLRVRGEYACVVHNRRWAVELPPRARRIPVASPAHSMNLGTTSACAENTRLSGSLNTNTRNYLRVRGEYPYPAVYPTETVELPPRARRILPVYELTLKKIGTTSACAENTDACPRGGYDKRNYLRVRGEYRGTAPVSGPALELPPRARRILFDKHFRNLHRGTTSACAENTSYRPARPLKRRNYLRVRGEYHFSPGRPGPIEELPPRARRIPSPTRRRR